MTYLTNGKLFKVSNSCYTLEDLAEYGETGSNQFYGRKETAMITSSGDNCFAKWDDAVTLTDRELVYINGSSYMVCVIDTKSSNGIRFVRL
jgi:hypothetical protein